MYHREIVYHVVETWIHTKTTARNKLKFEMESTHTHTQKKKYSEYKIYQKFMSSESDAQATQMQRYLLWTALHSTIWKMQLMCAGSSCIILHQNV